MPNAFRIRRIHDGLVPANREALEQVKSILRQNFRTVAETEVEAIGSKLLNPFKQRFRVVLFVAEKAGHRVEGFAMVLHEPEIGFCYLDWLAAAPERQGRGLGGALYERVREEARALDCQGLFFECLPDDSASCTDAAVLEENRSRLRFYEGYGARPIVGTEYEAPVKPGDSDMPHLVYDGLDRQPTPEGAHLRKVVRAILERKYGDLCPPEYVSKVVASIPDGPVPLRDYRYTTPDAPKVPVHGRPAEAVALVFSEKHSIHHIRDRGYVEAPVRIPAILAELEPSGLFERTALRSFSDKHILAVHDQSLFRFVRDACASTAEGKSLYPYVFPVRNQTRLPKDASVLAGYYCIDTFTPLHRNAFPAARAAVNCALTAARELLEGRRLAYALVRPPGHHAERRVFGGFCYFNNTAIAAQYLAPHGRTAILDIDFHHGNGQQDIFYERSDVLTVSIHGHPSFAYPYFSGFEDETGSGDGVGSNLNLPLPEDIDGAAYRQTLGKALARIADFRPDFLVVALGLDTAKGDPTGAWRLRGSDFEANGRMLGELGVPTVVIQEGGYRTRTLGTNAKAFFKGLALASAAAADQRRHPAGELTDLVLREEAVPTDPDRIGRLIKSTGFFHDFEIPVAVELVEDRLAKGAASDYSFVFAEHGQRLVGYTCYGEIACTAGSYDLYWIAVHPDYQGRGLGRILLRETEARIRARGGSRVYIETSSRPLYESTRGFYLRCGYRQEALLADFYGAGDGKVIYSRGL